MHLLNFIVTIIFLAVTAISYAAPVKITFPSEDGLLVSADVSITNEDKNTPFIVLFHQAGWSRGEYLETAPRLNALGFNCMAIDQRSGKTSNGVPNETKQRAVTAGKGTDYPDAMQDMRAAIAYAKAHYSEGKTIGFGSSYSSALIIKLSGDDANLVDGVLSFSPGEYFVKFGKPSNWITSSAANISKPVFITSRKNEQGSWQAIYDAIPAAGKDSFLPVTAGQHGSRALWAEFNDSQAYWAAMTDFLNQWRPSIHLYRSKHGLAADGSDDGNIENGVPNLIKYALGLAPVDFLDDSNRPAYQEGSGTFKFRRLKNRTDVIYLVETSPSMKEGTWTSIWSSQTHPYSGGISANITEQVALSTPPTATIFVRLRIDLP